MPRNTLGELEVELRKTRALLEGNATEGEIDVSEMWRLLREGREKAAALCELGSIWGLRWRGLWVGLKIRA